MKRISPEDWPSLILRGSAVVLIVVHLLTGIFIYSHVVFFLTAVVLALLLSREMYEDLACRFFKLKSEGYERDIEALREQVSPARDVGPVIEAEPVTAQRVVAAETAEEGRPDPAPFVDIEPDPATPERSDRGVPDEGSDRAGSERADRA